MIKFYEAFEGNCCKTFQTETRNSHPKNFVLWEGPNSDVPGDLEGLARLYRNAEHKWGGLEGD
jgi:hypothetical protein